MAGSVSIQEAPTVGIGQMISQHRFFVPSHQRDYRWDRDKAEKLFDDTRDAMDRDDALYFVGLMVFMKAGGRLRVLDGQQRLATTIMIFAALRGWFGANNLTEDSTTIQSQFIGAKDFGEVEPQPRLVLNRHNDDRFQKYVVKGASLPELESDLKSVGKHAPNRRMLEAIQSCHRLVAEVASGHTDANKTKSYFHALMKFIRDRVQVVRLTVPDEANAFRVFETLNDRGLELSAVDLLKNYIFGLVHESDPGALPPMEDRWEQIQRTLKPVKQEDFLRAYWVSRNGRTQLERVFEGVKTLCKTRASAENLSIDLLEVAEQYAGFEKPDDPVWQPYGDAGRATIQHLLALGAKQARPVVLSALKKFEPNEVTRLLRLLESAIVRWQLIGGQRTGVLEGMCARVAHKIWIGEIQTAAQARTALEEVWIDDDEFQRQFREKSGVTDKQAAYLLGKIEDYVRVQESSSGDPKALVTAKGLTVEHVLPKRPGNDWGEALHADPMFVKDCCGRLGNLALLTEKRNRDLGNAGWARKRDLFEKSPLITTRRLADSQAWDRKAIDHRQAWLASKAPDVWGFK